MKKEDSERGIKMDKKEFNLQREIEELRHSFKMQEIEAETEGKLKVEKTHHDNEMERQRIKSAEIRKSIERKQDKHFMENYAK